MRTGYAVTKVTTFCGLALAQALSGFPETVYGRAVLSLMSLFRATAWLAVAFCVFRGLPVIVHALRQYWSVPSTAPSERS
jgi:hypothetical protein